MCVWIASLLFHVLSSSKYEPNRKNDMSVSYVHLLFNIFFSKCWYHDHQQRLRAWQHLKLLLKQDRNEGDENEPSQAFGRSSAALRNRIIPLSSGVVVTVVTVALKFEESLEERDLGPLPELRVDLFVAVIAWAAHGSAGLLPETLGDGPLQLAEVQGARIPGSLSADGFLEHDLSGIQLVNYARLKKMDGRKVNNFFKGINCSQ